MSLDDLKAKLRDVDTREVFVWRDGFDDWKSVEDVPEVMPPRPPQPPPFRPEAHERKPIPSNTPSVRIAATLAGAAAALASALAVIGIAGLLDASAALPQWSYRPVSNFFIGGILAFAFAAFYGAKRYVERKFSELEPRKSEEPPTPRAPRSRLGLIAIPLLGAGLLYAVVQVAVLDQAGFLHDRFFLPECDSDLAKRWLAAVLKQHKLEPSRVRTEWPTTTVLSSKTQVICKATLPLSDGSNVPINYSFYWQGSQPDIRYSIQTPTAR
jgi:hypothetical protein